ncbi:UDP-N-acetylmuramate dehydrogenase, partial [Candidatus Sumerlaeota bacterium]
MSESFPDIPGVTITPDVAIGHFTSIGVPCTAHALVTAESTQGLQNFLRWADRTGEHIIVLGGGTNTLFADSFYDGFVIKLGQAFRDLKIQDTMLRAGCSIPVSRLLNIAVAENLTGLEFLWDIPGTLGGAIAGNAGSTGESICEKIEAVKGYDHHGATFAARRGDFTHSYRDSSLRGLVITEAIIALERSAPEEIQARLQSFKKTRRIQPIGVKSSGCIFKNPPGQHAGKLIDEA